MATKKKTRSDLISQAIKDYKRENTQWKTESRDEMYNIESNIDALLYEKEFKHIAPGYGSNSTRDANDEIILERLTFQAIREMSGRRHGCDPGYDDAFSGYDCATEVEEHSGKDHKHSKKKKK